MDMVRDMVRVKYIGSNPDLTGKGALIRPTEDPDIVWAQFDPLWSPYSKGWHKFPREAFQVAGPCTDD